jgi:hypothetical protein
MSFTPAIITAGDYDDIRTALGLAGTDTTTISDSVVESGAYLPFAEIVVKQKVTTWATIKAAGGDKAYMLASGVVLLTAARLAAFWMASKSNEEVERVSVGPYTTQYRKGVDWQAMAESLAREAAEALQRVVTWGESPARITLAGRSGPTRRAETNDTDMTLFDWQELLLPPVIKGHVFTEEDAV